MLSLPIGDIYIGKGAESVRSMTAAVREVRKTKVRAIIGSGVQGSFTIWKQRTGTGRLRPRKFVCTYHEWRVTQDRQELSTIGEVREWVREACKKMNGRAV